MAKKKYESLVNEIVDLVGGKENISFFTHCVTRLRFNVKDKGLVRNEEIKKIEGVMGLQWSGDQLQIIIGQSVSEVYKSICNKYGFANEEVIQENLDEKKKRISISSILDILSGCISPLIPIFSGCGMIKILLLILPMLNLLSEESSTYQILNMVGDAGFYFLPILLGYTSAKKFGMNEGLGMLIGAILIAPTFVNGVSSGTSFNFLGIPIYSTSYSYSMFPIILCNAVAAPIYRLLRKYIPEAISAVVVPFLIIIIMTPLSLCLLAPIGAFVGNYIGEFIIWLYNRTGALAVASFAAIYPYLVLTGMHGGLSPYMIQMLSTVGYEPIYVPSMVIANINLGVASLAVSLKSRNKKLKNEASGYAITALLGSVCEPALYGVATRYKTPLIAVTIGNFIAGLAMGLLNVFVYNFPGTAALFSFPIFIKPDGSGLIQTLICWLIGIIATFIATFVLYKDEKTE